MSDKMLVREAATHWGLTERRVTSLCKEGKIEGARKEGRSWVIPVDAQKPIDNRIKSGVYLKAKGQGNLPLPIGVSEYRIASTEYYYIDKTMLIKDFIDERPKVSLFTRPRRFGKTLNMDMLRTFFEKTEEDTSIYFNDKKIWKCGKKYQEYQGKYPVVFMSFKDIKFDSWEETLDGLLVVIGNEFTRHSELTESESCVDADKAYYSKVIKGEVTTGELASSLLMLSKMLHEHHGVAPIIIIDEYDTPIQQGYISDFYEEVILFMRNLFSGGLKDNHHLSYGFLTGILRVAKESIFSGLNNLKINSILDNKYSEYFGFTSDEVREMAKYYKAKDKYEEICAWYDGYRFGKTEIFNPWSVINYFNNECEPRAFWQYTGSNDIIGEILSEATEDIYEKLNALLQGESVLTYIDTGVIYPQIKKNPASVYSFLLVAGYLKVVKAVTSTTGDFMCEVALPNREISFVYNKEILQELGYVVPASTAVAIQEALYMEDVKKLKECIGKLLMQSVSCYDAIGENFYHGLVLGLCAMMDNRYYISSNRESGEGRYDISLMPRERLNGNEVLPGILVELKADKNCSDEKLKKLSEDALNQIKERKYDTEMLSKGVENIVKYGVAFSGKKVEITME